MKKLNLKSKLNSWFSGMSARVLGLCFGMALTMTGVVHEAKACDFLENGTLFCDAGFETIVAGTSVVWNTTYYYNPIYPSPIFPFGQFNYGGRVVTSSTGCSLQYDESDVLIGSWGNCTNSDSPSPSAASGYIGGE